MIHVELIKTAKALLSLLLEKLGVRESKSLGNMIPTFLNKILRCFQVVVLVCQQISSGVGNLDQFNFYNDDLGQ